MNDFIILFSSQLLIKLARFVDLLFSPNAICECVFLAFRYLHVKLMRAGEMKISVLKGWVDGILEGLRGMCPGTGQ